MVVELLAAGVHGSPENVQNVDSGDTEDSAETADQVVVVILAEKRLPVVSVGRTA